MSITSISRGVYLDLHILSKSIITKELFALKCLRASGLRKQYIPYRELRIPAERFWLKRNFEEIFYSTKSDAKGEIIFCAAYEFYNNGSLFCKI